MKQIYFILLSLLVILMTSCKEKAISYKEFSAHDKSYTVQIPSDFSPYYAIGNALVFTRESSPNDYAIISIKQTNDGLYSFEKSLNSDNKFKYSVYKRTDNAIFAQCVKGLFSAVDIGMVKTINEKQYVIKLSIQASRSLSEKIIEHIYNSMVEGIPSEIIENNNTSDSGIVLNKLSDTNKYTNPYFSISYPKDWEIVTQPDEMSDVYIGAKDGSLGFAVVRFDTEYSLAEIVSEANSNSDIYGMSVTSCDNMELNGFVCNKMVNEFEFQGVSTKTIAFSLKKANTFYSIKFVGERKCVDDNLDLIQEIMNTLNLQ